MLGFTAKELCDVCGGTIKGSENNKILQALTTDTREITENFEENSQKVFVALKGERFDGNDFAEEACRKNVGAVVCSLDDEKAELILNIMSFSYRTAFLDYNGNSRKHHIHDSSADRARNT